jgi:hypothetical protein
VKACGNGKHGIAKTKIVVSGATGKVKSAVVDGPAVPRARSEGSCIARAARGARFPRFKTAKSAAVDLPLLALSLFEGEARCREPPSSAQLRGFATRNMAPTHPLRSLRSRLRAGALGPLARLRKHGRPETHFPPMPL